MNVDFDIMQAEPFKRPDSVIRIYEIQDSSEANPQPDNSDEQLFGEFLSPAKLKQISGCSNLFDVLELKLKLDTTETSIGNLGSMVPNLRKLNLNNSFIASIRDLGTTLNNLTMLWLCRCSLIELDGISSFNSLRELFIAYNEIKDLSFLSMLETLEVLDLEGNNVDDITQVEFLSLCNKLSVLTLRGNPVEICPTPQTNEKELKFYSYQDSILSCLPGLKMLDDERFLIEKIDGKEIKRANPKASSNVESSGALRNDFKILQDSLKTLQVDAEEFVEGASESPDTACIAHPLSAQIRHKSAQIRQKSAKPPPKDDDTNDKENTMFPYEQTDCSDLTNGQIMCGNPVAALRKRNRTNKRASPKRYTKNKSNEYASANSFKPEHSYLTSEEISSESRNDLFEELRKWRMNNQALFEDSESTHYRHGATCRNSDEPIKSFSPIPPSKPRPNRQTRMRRSLQTPNTSPIKSEDRPHTVAACRIQISFEDSGNYLETNSAIDEDNEYTFSRVNHNFNEETRTSPLARPSTARAALQSSQ